MLEDMTEPQPHRRYRFGKFEADPATGELRRQGILIKLNAQPFQVLLLLLERPGELLTREQISRALWPDGTFVDYEHGVNSAVNRIREALGDTAGNPRFIETLARRGYRFVAPVECIGSNAAPELPPSILPAPAPTPESGLFTNVLATPEELPQASHSVVRTLFVLLQLMYVAFYVGALANLPEIEELFSPLAHESQLIATIVATATILIPVRAFLLSAVFFKPPRARDKLLRIWPFLLPLDLLWSLSPFLLLHHISLGLALACTALLVYSPFAQRSLVLMGAASGDISAPTPAR
jgi:DNA-binding winged helix-turn-helix (wHTH) protein